MSQNSVCLILGCWGLKGVNNFTQCHGIENIVLDISNHIHCYNELMNFFDHEYKLFDQPILNYSVIKQFLFRIQEKFSTNFKFIWKADYFRELETFVLNHRKCGCYLRLDIQGKIDYKKIDPPQPEKSILIRGRDRPKIV